MSSAWTREDHRACFYGGVEGKRSRRRLCRGGLMSSRKSAVKWSILRCRRKMDSAAGAVVARPTSPRHWYDVRPGVKQRNSLAADGGWRCACRSVQSRGGRHWRRGSSPAWSTTTAVCPDSSSTRRKSVVRRQQRRAKRQQLLSTGTRRARCMLNKNFSCRYTYHIKFVSCADLRWSWIA